MMIMEADSRGCEGTSKFSALSQTMPKRGEKKDMPPAFLEYAVWKGSASYYRTSCD